MYTDEFIVPILILVTIAIVFFFLGMFFYRAMHRRVKRRYDRMHCISNGRIH